MRLRSRAFAARRRFFLTGRGTCLRFRLPMAPAVALEETHVVSTGRLGSEVLGNGLASVRQDSSVGEVALVSSCGACWSGLTFGFRLYWRFFTGRVVPVAATPGATVIEGCRPPWPDCGIGTVPSGGDRGIVACVSAGATSCAVCCMAIRFSLYSSTSMKLRWGELASE
uniref:Uncharacterized protein n=1 Tax=Anopheles atroparvus TaxID=41427 RepID=A0AAG5CN39_ANOAO